MILYELYEFLREWSNLTTEWSFRMSGKSKKWLKKRLKTSHFDSKN